MGMGRVARTLALGLAVALAATAAAAAYLLRRPLPRVKGRLTLRGLESSVEILRDRWGVPHIYASNLRDVFFGVGYAQAQDRLWQMEFNRRLASGTLSEIAGEQGLEVDRLVRRIGFRRMAEREWQEADEEERAIAEAFSAGVNAYLDVGRLPLEFTLLRRRPAPWSSIDGIAFGRFISWTLAGNWDTEILRSWTIERFGPEVTADLEPGYPSDGPLIVPPGTEAKGAGPDLGDDFRRAAELIGAAGRGMSNHWAVDGQKSATGKPLLANDPHLPLMIPSLWWELHLDCPELKAAGVALPGTPGVMIGHNDRIAWGITAAIVDADDLFVERVNPDNPSQYEHRGEWVDGELIREEIEVRGRAKPVVEEVLITRHGPVVSPAIEGETRTPALRTAALEPSHQMRAQLLLMRAGNWAEFREALRGWTVPSLNFGYADVDGNIGYQLAGLAPIRAKGHGMVPVPGWTDEYDWTGHIPFEELPSSYNPRTHWLASANNKIADDSYPYFLGASYADSARQARIIEMLEAKGKLSMDDFRAMQADQLSLPARELVPRILALTPRDEWSRRALSFLRAWDYVVAPESVAACIFELFFSHLVRRALSEKLGSWSDYYMGKGIHPLRPDSMFFYATSSWLTKKMRERPDWFEGKSWSEAMEDSLASATMDLRRRLGNEVSRWQWGRLHRPRFRHPLGRLPGLSRIFDRGPIPMGGDANTVFATAYPPYHGYDRISFTPYWRQIIDLADFNRSLAVLPSGQSGHPGSRHYSDMIGMWQRLEYHPMPWDRQAVERAARARLVLAPAVNGEAERA